MKTDRVEVRVSEQSKEMVKDLGWSYSDVWSLGLAITTGDKKKIIDVCGKYGRLVSDQEATLIIKIAELEHKIKVLSRGL